MIKQNVFLSGGFKSNWQQAVIERFQNKFTFFNPRAHMLDDPREYTYWDIHYIRQADIIFAYLEKTNPSGLGLVFEVGVAYGLNKTIILVDEKSAEDEIFRKYFHIVKQASSSVCSSLEVGLNYLESFSRH
jgi:nucleoside 2-deoxyribosyltransferase